jgi:hypothetical protein
MMTVDAGKRKRRRRRRARQGRECVSCDVE